MSQRNKNGKKTGEISKARPKKRSKRRFIGRLAAIVLGISLAMLALIVVLGFGGAQAPEWVRNAFEQRLNANLNEGRINVGAIRLVPFDSGLNTVIEIEDIQLLDVNGHLRASFPEIAAEFASLELAKGRVRPISIQISGAEFRVARDTAGRFDLRVGEGGQPKEDEGADADADAISDASKGNRTFAEIISGFSDFLKIPVLTHLETIKSTGTKLTFDDALTGRAWDVQNGLLTFENNEKDIQASVTFELSAENKKPASVGFSWRKQKDQNQSVFSTKFDNIKASDIADQVIAFDWLRVLDAPISGAMALDVKDDGAFGNMHGVLDVGAGIVKQTEQTKPIRFSGAKAYLSYDQELEKFTFDEISLNTDAAHIVANGHVYLGDRIDRSVGAIISQLKFTKVELNPEGVFAEPVKFDLGAIDMRVQFDPLVVEIGQMVLVDGETRVVVKGRASARPAGWQSALDLEVNSLDSQRLIGLWPLIFKPKTRDWMVKNAFAGRLENIKGALRGNPGEKPQLNIGFDLADMNVRFMKTLPPIEGGQGYGVLGGQTLDLVLEQGLVTSPDGGAINMAGTVFRILNTKIKGSPAEVTLNTQSSISAFLSLLDMKPFEFLSKAGLATDIAKGTIRTSGKITLPLVEKVTFDMVSINMEGDARNVSTTKLIKGHNVTAKFLKVGIDDSGLTIGGQAKIGKVPVSGLWRQDFGKKHKGKSKLEGQLDLSRAFLEEFGIKLPKGSIKGRGTGHMTIDLERGKAPAFHLVSDLNRIELAIEALGWRKPKNVKGKFEARGSFGAPPKISLLALKTIGLEARGSVKLTPDGKLDVARFDTVNLDNWMKTPVEIRVDADGNGVFNLTGGELDFRKSRFTSSHQDTGTDNKITVKLDQLILSRGISLTDVEGNLSTRGGVAGSFSGNVNGGARIVGTLAPFNGGTGVRFTSDNAGAVMRSAGLFESAIGGRMDMILVPAGKSGHYNGTLKVTETRVRNASSLAAILSAISVVGLLEQLGGAGITFADVDAKFLITPSGVMLHEGSAVGTSLGLTMAGVYDFSVPSMDFQGVITPIYILNGVLEQTKIFGGLFGKQKGEGLFGFNYTLKGQSDAPKVGVNPLSILTPGMFRDIFRRPVPKKIPGSTKQ